MAGSILLPPNPTQPSHSRPLKKKSKTKPQHNLSSHESHQAVGFTFALLFVGLPCLQRNGLKGTRSLRRGQRERSVGKDLLPARTSPSLGKARARETPLPHRKDARGRRRRTSLCSAQLASPKPGAEPFSPLRVSQPASRSFASALQPIHPPPPCLAFSSLCGFLSFCGWKVNSRKFIFPSAGFFCSFPLFTVKRNSFLTCTLGRWSFLIAGYRSLVCCCCFFLPSPHALLKPRVCPSIANYLRMSPNQLNGNKCVRPSRNSYLAFLTTEKTQCIFSYTFLPFHYLWG